MDSTLFSSNVKRPLADRLRPTKLEEVVGQDHLVGEDAPLGRMIKSGKITSFILWGPPGCGKTTILRIIAGLETCDSGSVLLEGKDVTFEPPEHRDLNMVFQSYALFPHMSVGENIGYGDPVGGVIA